MNGLPPVISDIKTQFNQAVLSQNPNTNPTIKGTDWDVYGTALAAVVSLVRQDIQTATNSIFTQFEKGLYLDWKAYSLGQLPRRAETFATVSANVSTSTPIVIPAGTQFTTTYNNIKYVTIATISATGATNDLSLRSSQSGSGFSLPTGAILKSTTYPNLIVTVTGSSDGQGQETDSQLRQRLLFVEQNPTGGDREGQYVTWAQQSDPDVTDALVETELYPDTLIIGIFILVGGEDYDYLLLNKIPYSRTATSATIYNAALYLNAIISLGIAIQVASIALYVPANFNQQWDIEVSVNLQPGVELSTLITNIDGSPISIQDMVMQELRRAFITFDFGGEEIVNNQFSISTTRLTNALWNSLSVREGIYANILTDVTLLINGDALANIQVPHNYLDSNGNLVALYDLYTYDAHSNLILTPGYSVNIVKQAY